MTVPGSGLARDLREIEEAVGDIDENELVEALDRPPPPDFVTAKGSE